MKRILLLRHAEAADQMRETGDFDRPLTARGREDAALMGAFLASSGGRPELAVCSSAARARETLDCLCSKLSEPPHKTFNDAIYDAGPKKLLAIVQALPDEFGHVLLVGHNPGIHQFALHFAADPDECAIGRLAKKFPKGALAQLTVDIAAWRETDIACGRLIAFTRPKDLRAH